MITKLSPFEFHFSRGEKSKNRADLFSQQFDPRLRGTNPVERAVRGKAETRFAPFFFFFFFYPARRNYEVAAGATPASRRHPASNRIRAPLPACAPCLQLVNKSARTTRCLATITFSLATCATEILSTREEEEEEGEGRGIGPRRHKQNSRTVTRRDRLIFDNDENIARSRYQKRIRLFFLSFPFLFPFLCSSLLLSSRREK